MGNARALFGFKMATRLNMNVLVTGATGLKGSSIQRQLGSHVLLGRIVFLCISSKTSPEA